MDTAIQFINNATNTALFYHGETIFTYIELGQGDLHQPGHKL